MTVYVSVAKPGNPTNRCGPISNTFGKFNEIVCACIPNLLSVAIVAHLSPFIATMAQPL